MKRLDCEGGFRSLFLASLTYTCACASLRPAAPTQQFLERSYVFHAAADTSLLYEAQAATNIMLLDGMDEAFDAISTDCARRASIATRLIFTPMFRIRQLKDSSAAVRTPSFMPRLSGELLRVQRVGKSECVGGRPVYEGALLTGVRLTLGHHSNGQAGCFREGFEPIDRRSNQCTAMQDADTTTIRLNRADGDFSTTYLALLAHGTRTWMRDTDRPRATLGFAAGVDWHLPRPMFGALSDEQRELYGSWRARTLGELMIRTVGGRSRLTPEFEFAPRIAKSLQRRMETPIVQYRWSVELSHAFDALLGAGPFIRWNDGQDYYNIGFAERRRVFAVGLMIDLSGERIGARIVH